MIDSTQELPMTPQAELLDLSRSKVYSVPRPVSNAELVLMRQSLVVRKNYAGWAHRHA